MSRKLFPLICIALLFGAGIVPAWAAVPKNVILFIGDGMGFEHIQAARAELGEDLCFESFPHQGQIMTYPIYVTDITDSAAAGTALATGKKVKNGVVSLEIPGDRSELGTVLEYYKGLELSKSTGIVTTTYMTHATPATFGAHESTRYHWKKIAVDYFSQVPPINVLLGGGGNGLDAAEELAGYADYTIVTDDSNMALLDTENESLVSGQFGTTHLPYEYDEQYKYDDLDLPHLSEMTETALAILDNGANGFFLMVEGGRIDFAAHDNDYDRMIGEMVEFNNAVKVAIDWVEDTGDDNDWGNTLILVCSDHETGGFDYNEGTGEVSWSSGDHTDADVPIYAYGVNAYLVDVADDDANVMDNTFISTIVKADVAPVKATDPYPADRTLNLGRDIELSWRAGSGATSHDVYFGTDAGALELVSQQAETEYTPVQLKIDITYYWRIDEVAGEVTETGDVWNFTTSVLRGKKPQ